MPSAELISSKHYPYLNDGIDLYGFSEFGLIVHKSEMKSRRISKKTLGFLALCTGMVSFEEALALYRNSSAFPDDAEILEVIIAFSKMVRNGEIQLSDKPLSGAISVKTNSRESRFPEGLHVELTSACNLNCFYCYRDSGPAVKENRLPTRKLLEILFTLATKGLQVVELTGGEPLLHPDFISILDFCCRTFAQVSLLTNATLIDDGLIEKMLPYRNKIIINISLDSHIPQEHDRRCRVKGSFQKVTSAIRKLAEKRFFIRTAMAVDEVNWPHLEPTLLLSRELGARLFTYSAIIPVGRGENSFKPLSASMKKISEEENAILAKYPDFIHVMRENQYENLEKKGGCGAGHRTYAMDPEGSIRPCVSFDSTKGIIGCVARQKPEEIFTNEFTRLSSNLTVPKPEICDPCQYAGFCRNCFLRGAIASKWAGREKCRWLSDPDTMRWLELLDKSV